MDGRRRRYTGEEVEHIGSEPSRAFLEIRFVLDVDFSQNGIVNGFDKWYRVAYDVLILKELRGM